MDHYVSLHTSHDEPAPVEAGRRLPRRALRLFAVSAAVAALPVATANAATLAPANDGYVDSAHPTANYQSAALLKVTGTPSSEALFKFAVPSGSYASAELRLYATGSSTDAVTLRKASCSWTNSSVTWNTRPALGTAIGSAANVAAGWNKISVPTSAVPAGATACFELTKANGGTVNFESKDNTYAPQLVLTTTAPAPAPAPSPTPAPAPSPTPAPAPAPVPSPFSPTWSGNFDLGSLSQYYEVLRTTAGPEPGTRITFDNGPSLGGRSVRFQLRPGDQHDRDGTNRIQLRGINYGNHYFNEGQDLYFRWAIYVDPSTTVGGSFSNPWRTIVAWPSVQDGAFSPMKYFLMRESGGAASPNGVDSIGMSGDLGVSGAWDKTQWKIPVVKGRWYEFITHWKFSSNPAIGLVEHWMKAPGSSTFVKQTFLNGSQTMHMKTLSGSGAQSNLRLGLYRNHAFTTTDTVYYDNVYMGPSLASVGA